MYSSGPGMAVDWVPMVYGWKSAEGLAPYQISARINHCKHRLSNLMRTNTYALHTKPQTVLIRNRQAAPCNNTGFVTIGFVCFASTSDDKYRLSGTGIIFSLSIKTIRGIDPCDASVVSRE